MTVVVFTRILNTIRTRPWRSKILALMVFLLPATLRSQPLDLLIEPLSSDPSLLGKEVYDTFQDSRGYLWFGTEAGLNRYDGHNLTVYRHDPGNPSSIVNALVMSLWEDRQGILWIGTAGGLERFDRALNTFTHYTPSPQEPKGGWSNTIYDVFEDSHGVLWTGGDGLKIFDRSTGVFRVFKHDSTDAASLIFDHVQEIYEDRSGVLWIATGGGLERFDRENERFTHYWADENIDKGLPPDFYGFHWVQRIYEDRAGTLWLGTNGGPVAFNRETGEFKPYPIDKIVLSGPGTKSVSSLCEDAAGTLWIGTWGGGLLFYNAEEDRFVPLRDDTLTPTMAGGRIIISLLQDKSGVMWIGSKWGGVYRGVRQERRFSSYVHIPGDTTSLRNDDLRFIYQDGQGKIMIGTATGIDWFDPEGGDFTHVDWWGGLMSVTGALRTRSGTYWAGLHWDGLVKDFDDLINRRWLSTQAANAGGSACSLFEDRQGLLWMVTYNGVCQFDPHTETFKTFGISPAQTTFSARLIVEDSIDSTPQGWDIWIGTQDGLWRYHAATEAFTRFGYDPTKPRSLASNIITTVFRDTHGSLWIGTDRGLNRMDSTADGFEAYTVDNGLPENVVLGVVEDHRGRIWVSSPKAISRFDPPTNRFKSYSMVSILPEIRFSEGCSLCSTTGEVYFGGRGGFVVFNPDSIRDNPYVPPLTITGFTVLDRPTVLDTAVSEKSTFALSYKDNLFEFEFAALSFLNPEQNQYAYILEGYDDSWVYCGNLQYARYRNVPPGTYTFRVKGSNNDGIWNDEGIAIAVVISPPFWQTWWAYTIYGLSIVGLLYGLRRYEMNRQQLKFSSQLHKVESEQLKAVDELKSRFFANISHEFRTPLTLILGTIAKWSSRSSDSELNADLGLMGRHAQHLLRLVNQLLDLSKIEAGGMKLRVSSGDIVSFVKSITQEFQSAAAAKRIALNLEAEDSEIDVSFDREKIDNVVTNLLANALEFTPKGGSVEVSVWREAGTAFIKVSDTGIGIPEEELSRISDRFYQVDGSHTRSHPGTGIGLALAKELIEMHHGAFSVKSRVGKGSEFTIGLPLGSEHFTPGEIVESPGVAARTTPEWEVLPASEPEHLGPETPEERSQVLPLVLLVEDNTEMRTYIRQHLGPDYRILEACDGGQGVKQAIESIPDLIISDVMMPAMDGYALCKALKLDEKTSHVPIILLTAKASQESKLEGLETGADDYLSKPFDAQELRIRVKNLIEQRRRLRERFSKSAILKPGEVAVTSMDDAFLQKVMAVVERHMADEDFSVEQMGREIGMSRSQLHRKLTALTGQSPSEFIRYMRLHRAMELLKKNAATISEIAYTVGFGGVSYFTKCFREQFGVLPSEVRKS